MYTFFLERAGSLNLAIRSIFWKIIFVRPIILRITSPMLMDLTIESISLGINLHALYVSISSWFTSSVANFFDNLSFCF